MSTWNGYESSYNRWQINLKKATDSALKLPVSSAKERARKLTALQAVSDDIAAAHTTLCRSHTLLAWQQQLIGAVKTKQLACHKRVDVARVFGTTLQDTMKYLKNEQTLSSILTTAVGKQDKITETSFKAQLTRWLGVVEAIKSMPAETSFTPVKTTAVKTSQSIKGAWQALYEAHKKKDKTKYAEAQGKLADAYGSVSTISSDSTRHLAELAGTLQTDYIATFKQ